MFVSPSMSLSVASNSADPYDHNALAINWLRLDQHDHSFGRGVQISTAGIQDNAITTAKIAPGSVTSAQLASNIVLPAGMVIPYAGNITPTGFLFCNGQLISRSTYSALFSAIGITYGVGDGITTFAIPNLEDCFVVGGGDLYPLGSTGGASQVNLSVSNLAAHTHNITATDSGHTHNVQWIDDGAGLVGGVPPNDLNGRAAFGTGGSGVFPPIPTASSAFTAGLIAATGEANIAASADNTGAGSSFGILPPYISLSFVIKY